MSVAARALGPIAAAVLLLGIADSMAGSYLVLYAANDAGLSAVQTGVFMSAPAAGSIVASFLAGRGFDRRPSWAYAAVAAIAGAAGYAALLLTSSFVLMLLIGVVLLGAVGAAFPQLFALARLALAGSAVEHRAAPLLRSGWSLAWAVGPLLGALIVAGGSLRAVLAASAGVLVVTAAVVLAARAAPAVASDGTRADAPPARHPPAPLTLAMLTASVALFFTAMYAGSVALPLYVTRTMGRAASDVGLLYSACAFVEVLAALALAPVPARVSQKLLIVGAMVVFAGYFALTVTGSFELVVVGQVARGIGIAVVGAAGIRYFQDLSGAAVGRATTLFANATTAGGLVAGVLAGVSNEYLGYLGTLALCGVAALLAAVLFAAGRVRAG
jgi:SET family sugar efflux transporter-like MFS transporter